MEPEEEKSFDSEIPWEVVQHNSQGDTLGDVEETEDNPVCQPLYVILHTWRLDGLEGQVSRQTPANEVGDGVGEGVEQEEEAKEDNGAERCVAFGDLGALLERVRDRVFRELQPHRMGHNQSLQHLPVTEKATNLLVKLADVEIRLVGRLDVHGVLLDSVGGRHG